MVDAVLEESLVVSTAAAVLSHQVAGTSGSSYILYDDAFNDPNAVVEASSSVANYGVDFALNYLGSDFWQAAAGGTQTITLTVFPGRTVSYLGIAYHNLFSAQGSIDFQYSDDGVAWTTCLPDGGFTPLSDEPIGLVFPGQARNHFRLVITSVDAPVIGVLMAGLALQLQRSVYVGHRPAPYQRNVRFASNESEGGITVGRSTVRVNNETDLPLKRLSPAWVRQYWQPFARHAENLPFFFVWNKDSYEREVIFGWTDDLPKPSNEHQSFMAVNISIRGRA